MFRICFRDFVVKQKSGDVYNKNFQISFLCLISGRDNQNSLINDFTMAIQSLAVDCGHD